MVKQIVSEPRRVGIGAFEPLLADAVADLPGNLHLWQFDLDSNDQLRIDSCSDVERRRAGRFASRREGALFLRCRALLREVLAGYCSIPAEAIALVATDRRRPVVVGNPVAFSLSHSGSQLVVAILSNGPVGVDIQQVRAVEVLALARLAYDQSEVRQLECLSARDRQEHFFRLWVCREAVLKAVGVGFEGKDLTLQRDEEGFYRVSCRPTGWGDIAINEFCSGLDWSARRYSGAQVAQSRNRAGTQNYLGAVAWPRRDAVRAVRHFIVG